MSRRNRGRLVATPATPAVGQVRVTMGRGVPLVTRDRVARTSREPGPTRTPATCSGHGGSAAKRCRFCRSRHDSGGTDRDRSWTRRRACHRLARRRRATPRAGGEAHAGRPSPRSMSTDSSPTTERSSSKLQQTATSGAIWTVIGFGGGQAIRFASHIVLTRLLFREAFGLMSLTLVFLQALELFSDVGISASVIQDKRGDRRAFLNTAWTLQLVRGSALWLIACAAAIPYATAYDAPELRWLVPVVGFGSFIGSFNSTKLLTANRHLAMKSLMLIDLSAQFVASVVMIAWAMVDASPWALAAGSLASAVVRVVLSHRLPGPGNRLHWDRQIARSMLRFGKWILLNTLLTFAATQADRLIFGKLVTTAVLGVYNVATMLATLPMMVLGRIAWSVLFPMYSRLHEASQDLAGAFERSRQPMLIAGGWAIAGLLAVTPSACRWIYDDRWHDAGYMAQLLAAGNWFSIMESSIAALFVARGKPVLSVTSSSVKVVAMAVAIPVGFALADFGGALAGYSLAETLRWATAAILRRREGLPGFLQDGRMTLWTAVTGGGGFALARGLETTGVGPLVETLAVGTIVSLAWLPLGWPHLRAYLAKRRGASTPASSSSDRAPAP
ncbi:MAG: hypothetical protein B7733_18525 [Myxococcales bacterium FL481]|nr:MAG: hypothetical protein B7733_18525 [Myxococcales bacterium FL481]